MTAKPGLPRSLKQTLRETGVSPIDTPKLGFVKHLLFLKPYVDECARLMHKASRKRRLGSPWDILPSSKPADVLIIVPPFASLWFPSLAAHVLQSCVRRAGYGVDILYANMLLASTIGETTYDQIVNEIAAMVGERLFARAAFDVPPLGRNADEMFDPRQIFGKESEIYRRGLYADGEEYSRFWAFEMKSISVPKLQNLERSIPGWLDQLAKSIASRGYKIVGCTSTFQQIAPSIALLNHVKRNQSEVVTVLGGGNCEGEMAEGLATICPHVDYIFSGESEATFPEFVSSVLAGSRPTSRIVSGRPCIDLDALPTPAYAEYFQQRSSFLPLSASHRWTSISYETSRGCWWGQKQHCTFCGLNGEGMGYRRKSADRVIEELRSIMKESPTRSIIMADNIMPREYFKTLLPRMREELPRLNIFYEQKSNMSFDDVLALKKAGINSIQPGIEALSSRLLKLMRKGVLARQNLMLLRYGRIAGVKLEWNMLCGFPNDERAAYEETLALIPLIVHLQPPSGLWHLNIDRFSPYFFEPSAHNVKNIRPWQVYEDFLPEGCDTRKIAYHFEGDYPCATHQHLDFVAEVRKQTKLWIQQWSRSYKERPELKICQHNGRYVLVDTRGVSGQEIFRYIEDDEAVRLMHAKPYADTPQEHDAVKSGLAVVVDNWFVPLAVAQQDVYRTLTEPSTARVPNEVPEHLLVRASAG